jgi:hypothetical protein
VRRGDRAGGSLVAPVPFARSTALRLQTAQPLAPICSALM